MAFITNSKEGKSLQERLMSLIGHTDRLDMLVGFFFFSGVKVIYDALKAREQMTMRVLVGMQAEMAMGRLVEDTQTGGDDSADAIKARFIESMRKIVGTEEVDTQAFHERLGLFISMLESGRLEIRKTRDPNHAKLYIFTMDEATRAIKEKIFITGSSNFSEPGLKLRNEFNVEISDFGTEEAQKYFDDLWDKAVPLTENAQDRAMLIKILRESSVAAEVTPYEAYYLVLKTFLEHQKKQINEERLARTLQEAGFAKYRYQVDAVAQAMQKLDQYGGVIIGDVVGLGKSVIAGLIGVMRRRRGIVICPPGLMGAENGSTGGWHEYLKKFKLHDWVVRSSGKLEDVLEELKRDTDFDMVVVDEAHNFRNQETTFYANLANICFGKEVVLLTATPFNNRPGDLLSLLRLFMPAKSGPLGDIEDQFRLYQARYSALQKLSKALGKGEPDWKEIHEAMKKCDISPLLPGVWNSLEAAKRECVKRSKKLSQQVRQVMEKVIIRRNRLDLTRDDDYRGEITTLSEVKPPKEQFFALAKEQDEFYDRVIRFFGEDGGFHGAIYHPQDYRKDQESRDDAQKNIYIMLLRQMVQRFESSFGAFRKSLENVYKVMEMAKKFIDWTGTYLYGREAMEKILLLDDDEDVFEAINEYVKEREEKARMGGNKARQKKMEEYKYIINDADFRGDDFMHDLQEDMANILKLREEIDRMNLVENDPKAIELCHRIKQVLNREHPAVDEKVGEPKRKVLVFSGYADTIEHIGKYVDEAFPGRVMKVTGKNFGARLAKACKEDFDASFETQKDEYDILLATDKMSEGFNLNRAGVVVNYDIPWNPTRVIQRVGRINRIGRKVFDNLYIFNFFPTKKGEDIVRNKQVAQDKMFAIHRILGEDAQIFSLDEEPNPSALYDKLCKLDDGETISFYTAIKEKFSVARKYLEKHHPETLDKVEAFPHMVKTAWECKKDQPKVTLMFKQCGAVFSVVGRTAHNGEVQEWTMDESIGQIECKFDTPREEFSKEFWQYENWDKDSGKPRGVYEELKAFKPKGIPAKGGMPDDVVAVNFIHRIKDKIPVELRKFSQLVAEDLQSFGTIPDKMISQIAKCERLKDDIKAVDVLIKVLLDLRDTRGENYLDEIRKRANAETILITIEKK